MLDLSQISQADTDRLARETLRMVQAIMTIPQCRGAVRTLTEARKAVEQTKEREHGNIP